ncbi:MAG: hypothetical protein J0H49_02580 [Acidobacteria bacterium]|nr:hypothetical protein [Acidobacteriota bacterium]
MRRRSLFALPALLPAALAAPKTPPLAEKISAFGLEWDVIAAADWKVSASELELVVPRPQEANPRRPVQFALAQTEPLAKFTLDVEVKRKPGKGSLVLVYAWQKDGYFDYVHLSNDSPEKVEVHNGIFHCFNGDRVRISPTKGPGTLLSEDWYKVKITYDASKGLVECWVNAQTSPALKGIDLSLGAGRIGLGSFFDTGSFRNFKLTKG